MWQPIETAPMDQFLLLCGPSGYTTPPMVVTTGRMCSDYHAGRWIDHANDDLTDWGFKPMHWAPLVLPGAQPAESIKDDIIDDLQSQFDTEGITEHDSGDALIRLYDAIAAVEDNFAQPTPSIPEVDALRAASNNDREITPLERRCYLMGETHLSGYRLIIGFESLEDCNNAHDFLIRHYPKLKTPEAKP